MIQDTECPALGLRGGRGFNCSRDLHGNHRDVCDLGLIHAAEFAVLGGSHGAHDARSGLDKLCGFHSDFLVVCSASSCIILLIYRDADGDNDRHCRPYPESRRF
jgi:hypothetical protein